jgi:ABC-type transporter Mla subunit MlaD
VPISVGRIIGEIELQDRFSERLREAATQTDQFASKAKGVEVAAKGIENSLRSVESEMKAYNDLVAKFSGSNAIQKAQDYADAVNHVGGVTKISVAQQRELNKVLQEAQEAYQRLGKEAPYDIELISRATRKLSGEGFGNVSTSLSSLASGATHLGFILSSAVTAPLVAAGVASVHFGADFEKEMTAACSTLAGASACGGQRPCARRC